MLGKIFVAAILVISSAPAIAQDMTAEQRAACKSDYEKFCKGTMPGGGRIIACLSRQNDKLTDACKKVVAGARRN